EPPRDSRARRRQRRSGSRRSIRRETVHRVSDLRIRLALRSVRAVRKCLPASRPLESSGGNIPAGRRTPHPVAEFEDRSIPCNDHRPEFQARPNISAGKYEDQTPQKNNRTVLSRDPEIRAETIYRRGAGLDRAPSW